VAFGHFQPGGLPVSDRLRHDQHDNAYPKTCEALHRQNVIGMGKASAVYVRDGDLALWARAEAYARRKRMPMSGLIMTALEEYLARHGEPDERVNREG
jgi:hypothetical protein